MAANNNFSETLESMFKGMDEFVSAKTVVGEAVTVNDTTIIPLVDVSFGMGAGTGSNDSKKSGSTGGGMGGKISASGVLVVKDGAVRLVNIKNQDAINKVIDMVPEVIDKVSSLKKKDPEVEEAIQKAAGK